MYNFFLGAIVFAIVYYVVKKLKSIGRLTVGTIIPLFFSTILAILAAIWVSTSLGEGEQTAAMVGALMIGGLALILAFVTYRVALIKKKEA